MGVAPDFSVIIPSYQARATIQSCLQSLQNQVDAPPFEVIIVDSSQDGTADFIRINFPSVKLLTLKERAYPGEARNKGMTLVQGKITAFLNSNCDVPPDWLKTMSNIFNNPQIEGLSGTKILPSKTTLAGQIQFWLEFYDFLSFHPPHLVNFAPTANCAFRTASLKDITFPEDLRTVEDRVFGEEWIKRGHQICFRPDVKVIYHAKKTWSEALFHLKQLGSWSAKARIRYGLPGKKLATWWIFIPFLLPYRLARIFDVFLRHQPRQLPRLFLYSPFIIGGLSYWTWGYFTSTVIEKFFSNHKKKS
ncbi:hypothetical protein BVX98_01350 [bacterium F11]|nr:hypothetical protein BVX98_01350 [bacterium F11]